jgi:hypothetical protein
VICSSRNLTCRARGAVPGRVRGSRHSGRGPTRLHSGSRFFAEKILDLFQKWSNLESQSLLRPDDAQDHGWLAGFSFFKSEPSVTMLAVANSVFTVTFWLASTTMSVSKLR